MLEDDIRCDACDPFIWMKVIVSIAAVAALIAAVAPCSMAQQVIPPLPQSAYTTDAAASAAGEYAVPMPSYDRQGDGSVVTVPIPGGGEVRVEGPDLPAEAPLSPIETWGEHVQMPNTVMPSPMGP